MKHVSVSLPDTGVLIFIRKLYEYLYFRKSTCVLSVQVYRPKTVRTCFMLG